MKPKYTRDQLREILRDAEEKRVHWQEVLFNADLREDQVVDICNVIAQATIIKAAITSMEMMK